MLMARSGGILNSAVYAPHWAMLEVLCGNRESNQLELLLCAILEQAMRDYVGIHESEISPTLRTRISESAGRWFESRTERPFSFCWVCLQLGLSAEYVWSHRAEWLWTQRAKERRRA